MKGSLKLAVDMEAANGLADTVILNKYRQYCFHKQSCDSLVDMNSHLWEGYGHLL
jgi:hypothetical protein